MKDMFDKITTIGSAAGLTDVEQNTIDTDQLVADVMGMGVMFILILTSDLICAFSQCENAHIRSVISGSCFLMIEESRFERYIS